MAGLGRLFSIGGAVAAFCCASPGLRLEGTETIAIDSRLSIYETLEEPVWLSLLSECEEIYRVWFEPSFGDTLVARVCVNPNGSSFVSHRLSEDSRDAILSCLYRQRSQSCDVEFVSSRGALPHDQGQDLVRLIRKSGFWTDFRPRPTAPLDASDWALEGRKGQHYKRVEIDGAADAAPFGELGAVLLSLTPGPRDTADPESPSS